jgi:hypothetical protein
MMNVQSPTGPKNDAPYGGYHQTREDGPDEALTGVGPGTPGGEYLRRFWHPVALESELAEVPQLIRILGEDLVLYRDRSGTTGLVHRNCPHRRASLEFGVSAATTAGCSTPTERFWRLPASPRATSGPRSSERGSVWAPIRSRSTGA